MKYVLLNNVAVGVFNQEVGSGEFKWKESSLTDLYKL